MLVRIHLPARTWSLGTGALHCSGAFFSPRRGIIGLVHYDVGFDLVMVCFSGRSGLTDD